MTQFSIKEENYSLSFGSNYVDSNYGFALHSHDGVYEILYIEEGTPSFWVEGTSYPLSKGDIVIARQDEMHRIIHMESYMYKRLVINIKTEFFNIEGCDNYAAFFENRPVGLGNYFPSNEVFEDIIARIKKYVVLREKVLVKLALCELSWALNSASANSLIESRGFVQDIVLYINENITQPLTLEKIAEHFYISKYHLCRIFKEKLGLTVAKYITHKRIMMVKELCASGKNITEACISSGFGDYSSFYVAYKKETGKSPNKELKK